jgi:hypothetical protein
LTSLAYSLTHELLFPALAFRKPLRFFLQLGFILNVEILRERILGAVAELDQVLAALLAPEVRLLIHDARNSGTHRAADSGRSAILTLASTNHVL